jgi:CO dehydrogenase maturation factor
MKIAVVGKGGSGKTTTAAVVARTAAQHGYSTVALDCDTNPNLGISLGLGEERTESVVTVRDAVDAGEQEHAHDTADLLERFGVRAPDGVLLAVVSAIQNPRPGCPCCGISPEQLLGQLETTAEVVVADFEAGLGTVMRLPDGAVDVVIVVVEPTATSLDVGRRAAEVVGERSLGRLVVTANRVRDDSDRARVAAAFPGLTVVNVPDEAMIVAAERAGTAPLDHGPDSPGVRALVALAEVVLPRRCVSAQG